MIAIYAVACLMTSAGSGSLSTPVQCRDLKLVFEGEANTLTPQLCIKNGQIELSKWIIDHPNFWITKWHCGDAEGEANL